MEKKLMRREARKNTNFIPDQVEDDKADSKDQEEKQFSLFKR